MFFTGLLIFSSIIANFNNSNNDYYNHELIKIQNNTNNSNNIINNKIGIIDFRYILKRSNAMKLLGNKFLLLENKINKQIKQRQNSLKIKEEEIKKNKSTLSEIEYKKRIKLFKEEVFQIQKKYKDERALLNR